MRDDVIVGGDGRPRCGWAGDAGSASARYHDQVWGTRTYEESALFEALTLGVFEAGLSWQVVFSKREGFQDAFGDFDVETVVVPVAGRQPGGVAGSPDAVRSTR